MTITKVEPAGWLVVSDNGEKTYFGEYGQFGCYRDDGVVYKNQEAFDKGEGVCYIPEFDFENADRGDLFEMFAKEAVASEIVGNLYYAYCGYTRKDLEEICEGHHFNAEELFDHLDWQHPESLADEWAKDEEENPEYYEEEE